MACRLTADVSMNRLPSKHPGLTIRAGAVSTCPTTGAWRVPSRADLEGYTGKLPWKGIGWYRKHFTVPAKDRGRQVYPDFDGAMANAEIWLNGHKVGHRPYGYISSRVDLTPYVRWGEENVVAVRLDTEKLGSRWYPGAGIYRHVRMVKTNPVHVAHWGVFVTTPVITETQATAQVMVKMQNCKAEATQCSYSVDIHELKSDDKPGRRVASLRRSTLMSLAAGGNATDSVRLVINSPKLPGTWRTPTATWHVYPSTKARSAWT